MCMWEWENNEQGENIRSSRLLCRMHTVFSESSRQRRCVASAKISGSIFLSFFCVCVAWNLWRKQRNKKKVFVASRWRQEKGALCLSALLYLFFVLLFFLDHLHTVHKEHNNLLMCNLTVTCFELLILSHVHTYILCVSTTNTTVY